MWCIRLDDRVDCRSFGADEVSLSIPGEMQDAWFASDGVCAEDSNGKVECAAWSGRRVSASMRAQQSLAPILARSGRCMRDESGRAHLLDADTVKPESELGTAGSLHCEHGLECNLGDGELRCLWPKRGGDIWMQPFSEMIVGSVDPDRLARMSIAEVYTAPHMVCVRSTEHDVFCRSIAEFTEGAVYEVKTLRDATVLTLTEHAICGAVESRLRCVTGGWWKDAVAVREVDDVVDLRSTRNWIVAKDASGAVSFVRAGKTSASAQTVEGVDGMAVGESGLCVVRERQVGCFAMPMPEDVHWVSL